MPLSMDDSQLDRKTSRTKVARTGPEHYVLDMVPRKRIATLYILMGFQNHVETTLHTFRPANAYALATLKRLFTLLLLYTLLLMLLHLIALIA